MLKILSSAFSIALLAHSLIAAEGHDHKHDHDHHKPVIKKVIKQSKLSSAPFLKPEEAIAKMTIPEGFEITNFVSDPDIGETIAMCFDSRGRLWALDNSNYVNRRSHFTGADKNRIQIFEDTDGDGRFDKKKVFIDGIPWSSGIAVGHGGVYVGTPPYLHFYPDADGDDKPDSEPEVLLDGWGIQDRHETLNSFIWGPDGWMYGCHGVATQSKVGRPGTPMEDRELFDAAIWRFHPIRKEFEIYAWGLSNPWGFDFNDVGDGFSTMCVIPHLFHIVQGGVYTKQHRQNYHKYIYDNIKTIRDHEHMSAHGGARFYLGGAFPEKFRDQLFMCNIHEHAVLIDYMVRNGSSYIGKHGADFVYANDLAWVGFSIEIGADGAVYILDWHDQDICGNAINFPNSARVYRLAPKGLKNPQVPDLRKRSDVELAQLQMHKNDWYVRTARVILQERAAKGQLNHKLAEPILWETFKNADTIGKRLRGMWALHSIGTLKANGYAALLKMLSDKNEYVRGWAVRLLCEEKAPEAAVAKFKSMAKDESSPIVRRYLSTTLQRLDFDQRWDILEGLANHEEDVDDHLIPKMLWLALEPMVVPHMDRAMDLAFNSKMPRLQEYVTRRAVAPYSASLGGGRESALDLPPILKLLRGFKVTADERLKFEPKMVKFDGRRALRTYPMDDIKTTMVQTLNLSGKADSSLFISCGVEPHQEWLLEVRVGSEVVLSMPVNSKTTKNGLLNKRISLAKFKGEKTVQIFQKTKGKPTFAFWRKIQIN